MMKKTRALCLILSLVLLVGVFISTSIVSSAATNSAAANAVENICNTVGYRPSVDNYNDCYAYASAFCNKLYGCAPGGTSGYTLTRPGNFYLVGQTCGTGVTASTLSALLSQAMPGDVVQMYWNYGTGRGQHTAIVYSADSTSFTILQDGASFTTIKKSTYTYSSQYYRWSGSGYGISLYRYNGYNSLFGGDPTPTPTPSYADITPDTYYIKNNSNGEYLMIANNEDVQDGNVCVWPKLDQAGMKMVVSRASTGYKFRPSACSSRVVNVYADAVSSGNNVNIRTDTNNSTQWWYFESVSGGYVIRNVQNPSCVLTVGAGNDSRNVSVNTYTGASSQIWTLESVSESTPVNYTISYNANGGWGEPAAQTKQKDVNLTISAQVPERFQYTFLGWSTSADATSANYRPGDNFSKNANTTLYAVWDDATELSETLGYRSSTLNLPFAGGYKYYKITPKNELLYRFESFSNIDTQIEIYYSNGTLLARNYDSGEGKNYRLDLKLPVGDTYFIKIIGWNAGEIPYSIKAECKISYNSNGGSGVSSNEWYWYNDNITIRETIPTRAGYTFLSWSTSSTATSATYSAGDNFTVNGNRTLYAVWKANTYSVKYNANGGTGTMSNSTHTYGVKTALSANKFTRTGYVFLGWSRSKTDTTATYKDKQSVSMLTGVNGRVVNLYAVWKPISYTVKYNANGGTGSMSNSAHTYGTAKALSANKFTRTGYTFAGWSKTKNATTATYTNKQVVKGLTGVNGKTVVLYAVWKPNTYTVKYHAHGGTGTMSTSKHTYGTYKALNENKFTRPGYKFMGWSASVSATSPAYVNKQAVRNLTKVNGNTVTLYAVWKPITYTVKYHAHGGTGTMSNSTHTYGTAKALNANKFTRTGYTFLGWSASVSATSPTYTNKQSVMNITKTNGKTITLYAVWKPVTYYVDYNANGGKGTMSDSTHTFGVSKALSANKFTRTGYTFLGWSRTPDAKTATYTNKQAVSMLTGVQGKTVTLYAVWQKK